MSAIGGFFRRDLSPASYQALNKMAGRLSHRGKDGSGSWMEGPSAMCHLMRWITPESLAEKLPLYDTQRNLVITADARLDNRDQLFSKLDIPRTARGTISDSELILLGYDKWSEHCVEHLVGDYSFAIWDTEKLCLFCATDPMGMRPIYYYLDDKLFAFATEIKALLALEEIPKRINDRGFAQYVVIELAISEREETCFDRIFLLTSGKSMKITQDSAVFRSHGFPDFSRRLQLGSEEDYLEAFREIFDEAVRCRMRSAFPVSSLLSGGLDSSAITCIAAEHVNRSGSQLGCISRVLPEGFTGPEKDERYYIDMVKDQCNVKMSYVIPPGNGVYDQLAEECLRVEHPFVDPRHYQYRAFQSAAEAQGSRVILDGYGGESSASSHGKGYLSELAWRLRWVHLTREVLGRSRIEQRSPWLLLYSQVLRPFAPAWMETLNRQRRHDGNLSLQVSPLNPDIINRLGLENQLRKAYGTFGPFTSLKQYEKLAYELDRGETVRLFDAKETLTLYPYLDIRLLQFCFSVPPELRINKGWARYLLRAGLKNVMPDEIRWRRTKNPFSPDHPRRLKQAENAARDILQSVGKGDPVREYVDVDRLSKILTSQERQPTNSFQDAYTSAGRAGLVQRGIYAIVFYRVFTDSF
jgi:asparagine synthase (glutamine-hydrolysing)